MIAFIALFNLYVRQREAETLEKYSIYQINAFKVPTRVPVVVNMTIAGRPTRKQDCQMVERTVPRYRKIWELEDLGLENLGIGNHEMFSGTLHRYKTEMQERNETRTRQVCEPKMEERCVNFTLPSFEKVTVL